MSGNLRKIATSVVLRNFTTQKEKMSLVVISPMRLNQLRNTSAFIFWIFSTTKRWDPPLFALQILYNPNNKNKTAKEQIGVNFWKHLKNRYVNLNEPLPFFYSCVFVTDFCNSTLPHLMRRISAESSNSLNREHPKRPINLPIFREWRLLYPAWKAFSKGCDRRLTTKVEREEFRPWLFHLLSQALITVVTYQPKEHVAPSERVFWNFPKVDLVVVCWFRDG